MRSIFLTLLFIPLLLNAQFKEEWRYSDFSVQKIWSGSVDKFEPISKSRLQLFALPENADAFISRESKTIINTTWHFFVNMTFNPSSGNYIKVYLACNQPVLNKDMEGYYIVIGGAMDDISLWKRKNSRDVELIDGVDDVIDKDINNIEITVSRDKDGTWILDAKVNGIAQTSLRTFDDEILNSSYFGLYCKYTPSYSSRMNFGKIELTKNTLDITNKIQKNTNYKRYDIVINELMTDPIPAAGLPEEEYVEIYNRTDKKYKLKDLYLLVNDKRVYLPDSTMNPKQYMLIVDAQGAYASKSNVVALSSMPELNNLSGKAAIVHKDGTVIDAIRYPLGLKQDDFKKDGGWSMERNDVNNDQNDGSNWQYSVALDGGTPGFENSVMRVNVDKQQPYIKNIIYIDNFSYELEFSEAMGIENLSKDNISGISISHVKVDPVFLDKVWVTLSNELKKNVIHTFKYKQLPVDMNGNELNENYKLRIAAPDECNKLDLIINEILFNPLSGGVDFIELYNNSNKVFDLNDIRLANLNENAVAEELMFVTKKDRLFYPHEHLVVSEDLKRLKEQYKNMITELLVEAQVPTMPDDKGNIAVCTNKGEVLDVLYYNKDMQSALLKSGEGVSLERIAYNAPTNNINNWHSASSDCGFGTPTRENSQISKDIDNKDKTQWLWLTSQEFSPDNDGYQDVLQLNYRFSNAGWIGSVVIYDRAGREIRRLLNANPLASSGFVVWDGVDANRHKAPVGIYIVYAYFYNASGGIKKKKLSVVLTAGRR